MCNLEKGSVMYFSHVQLLMNWIGLEGSSCGLIE